MANPYHDKRTGQFASRGGSRGLALAAASRGRVPRATAPRKHRVWRAVKTAAKISIAANFATQVAILAAVTGGAPVIAAGAGAAAAAGARRAATGAGAAASRRAIGQAAAGVKYAKRARFGGAYKITTL